MQVIENVVSNLEITGTQNEFAGWLLSASFDSAACYLAFGEFMCAFDGFFTRRSWNPSYGVVVAAINGSTNVVVGIEV